MRIRLHASEKTSIKTDQIKARGMLLLNPTAHCFPNTLPQRQHGAFKERSHEVVGKHAELDAELVAERFGNRCHCCCERGEGVRSQEGNVVFDAL